MIIDPFKKYYKNELANDGYKLAFLDTSALPHLNMKIATNLKNSKIRPVVDDFVLSEFIKGLDHGDLNYQQYYSKKIEAMRCLDEMNSLFLLPHQIIETAELRRACDNLDKLDKSAYDFLEIFASTPVDTNYSALTKYTYAEYLKSLIDPDCRDVQKALNDGLDENIESANILRDLFPDFCDRDRLLIRKVMDRHSIIQRLRECCVNSEKVDRLANILYNSKDQYLHYAPSYSTSNYIFWKQLSTKSLKKNNEKKKCDFMDSMHFVAAMSYCDFFVSYDDKMIDEEIYQKALAEFGRPGLAIYRDFTQWT